MTDPTKNFNLKSTNVRLFMNAGRRFYIISNSVSLLIMMCLMVTFLGCAAQKAVGGPVQGFLIKDGVYEGASAYGPVKVVAQVTILKRQIERIDLTRHRTWKGKPAQDVIPARIIAAQSTRVDGVSGATMSSVAIMNAVEDAVQKAKP